VAGALGLGATLSPEQVVALEERCRREGRFDGQGCGEARDLDGIQRGAYWSCYRLTVPDGAETFLTFGHIQHGDHPPFSLRGPDFSYRRQGDLFVLEPPTGNAH
jgi:hypothetical protein